MSDMRKLINLIESVQAEQLSEAPIPSYGNAQSDDNKFDRAGAEKYPLSTSQKIDNALTIIAGATAAGFAGKGTWDFFDPSTVEGMALTGITSLFTGLMGGTVGYGIIASMSDHSEVYNARREFSKQMALQVAKENPEILKDIAGFKKSFLNSTPTAILKQSIELANILYHKGKLQDFNFGRFSADPSAEPIFGVHSDTDTAKRTKVLINIIGKYIAHYDGLFDSIAEKHGMTDQDLGAFLYHINGETDLVADWFEAIKAKAGLQLS
jgi:hypothetical protein